MNRPVYTVRRTARPPAFQGQWSDGIWGEVSPLEVRHFHAASSDHRPVTEVKLVYDHSNLYLFFRVRDRYVRAVAEGFQSPVCTDSCVEAFLQPHEDRGYFNFELNCGGTLLLYYIEDPRRTEQGFARYTVVSPEHVQDMQVYHSLPQRVDPEIREPTEWCVEYGIPLSLFEAYTAKPALPPFSAEDQQPGSGSGSGSISETRPEPVHWRANFFKCGDETSHPHWASWAPIGTELNFHAPQFFGILEFGP